MSLAASAKNVGIPVISKPMAINGKQPKTQFCNLAKVGVEGSNPFARSSFPSNSSHLRQKAA
jgi:hypothetical protein